MIRRCIAGEDLEVYGDSHERKNYFILKALQRQWFVRLRHMYVVYLIFQAINRILLMKWLMVL